MHSNKDPEKDYSNMTDALKFIFEQMLKNVYVSIPGVIDSYNPATKRATVHPAIKIQKTDGSILVHESIVNVPVVWPSGGGFTLISPLPQGEPVEILFSQRGITKFKEVFTDCDPGIGLFDKEDAYIIPGFGALSITPATEIGISLQLEDGTEYVYIEPGKISIKSAGLVEVDCVNLSAMVSAQAQIDCANLVANVSGVTDITSPTVNLVGNLIVTGGISWSGVAQGAGGSPAAFSGGLANTGGDIVSDGKSLETHTHPQGNDSNGDTEVDTGPPV